MMKKNIFLQRSLKMCLSFALLFNLNHAFAQENNEVDFDMNQVTAHELAMLAVVVESCPTLIKPTAEYQNNIKKIVTAHLPDAKNPLAELKIRSQSDELKTLMVEARQTFNEMGDEANTSLCEDIRDYKE